MVCTACGLIGADVGPDWTPMTTVKTIRRGGASWARDSDRSGSSPRATSRCVRREAGPEQWGPLRTPLRLPEGTGTALPVLVRFLVWMCSYVGPSDALHCGGHPYPRHLEKLLPNLLVFSQSRQAAALSCVFLVCCHDTTLLSTRNPTGYSKSWAVS